jgi:hypothetical protein
VYFVLLLSSALGYTVYRQVQVIRNAKLGGLVCRTWRIVIRDTGTSSDWMYLSNSTYTYVYLITSYSTISMNLVVSDTQTNIVLAMIMILMTDMINLLSHVFL